MAVPQGIENITVYFEFKISLFLGKTLLTAIKRNYLIAFESVYNGMVFIHHGVQAEMHKFGNTHLSLHPSGGLANLSNSVNSHIGGGSGLLFNY